MNYHILWVSKTGIIIIIFSSFFSLTRKNKFFGELEIVLKGTGYSSKAWLACRTGVTFCVLQVNNDKH